MAEYSVIDNYLSSHDFAKVKSLLGSGEFSWYMSESIADPYDSDDCYFCHNFFINYSVNSNFWQTIVPFLDSLKANAYIRVRALLFPRGKDFREYGWHTDTDYPHKGAILYLNTNNGYTVLEDGTKIESVENRVLFTDLSFKHRSTNCTDAKYRSVLTANYF